MSTVASKVWPVDLTREALEKMILAAASDGDQTIELSDGRRFRLTARAVTPKITAKEFLGKGGPLGDDEGFDG